MFTCVLESTFHVSFVVFGAAVINTTSSPEFSFPSGKSNGVEKIDIPSSVFVSKSGKIQTQGHESTP